MRDYQPRRLSKRWLDGDCPEGVLAIYDDPRTSDRYTIFYRETSKDHAGEVWVDYRAASVDPFNPCGIGLYCQMKDYQVRHYRAHNGHRKATWSSLPEDVKRLVRQDLTPEPEEA